MEAVPKAIRAIKADAVLIGEIWDDARSFLEGDQFDSAMNYNLTFAIVDAIANGRLTALQFAQRISYLLMRYQEPIQAAQMNLIDSHDIPRFLSQAGGSRDKLKQAVLFLLTHTGVPMVSMATNKVYPDGMRASTADQWIGRIRRLICLRSIRKPFGYEGITWRRSVRDIGS